LLHEAAWNVRIRQFAGEEENPYSLSFEVERRRCETWASLGSG
jgi:hypothetical protein